MEAKAEGGANAIGRGAGTEADASDGASTKGDADKNEGARQDVSNDSDPNGGFISELVRIPGGNGIVDNNSDLMSGFLGSGESHTYWGGNTSDPVRPIIQMV